MEQSKINKYCCPHCGTPMTGRTIGMMRKKKIRKMCQACEDYIGSPAAQQDGATMNNRRAMEALFEANR